MAEKLGDKVIMCLERKGDQIMTLTIFIEKMLSSYFIQFCASSEISFFVGEVGGATWRANKTLHCSFLYFSFLALAVNQIYSSIFNFLVCKVKSISYKSFFDGLPPKSRV